MTLHRVWAVDPPEEGASVTAVCWRPDGRLLAVGYTSGDFPISVVICAFCTHFLPKARGIYCGMYTYQWLMRPSFCHKYSESGPDCCVRVIVCLSEPAAGSAEMLSVLVLAGREPGPTQTDCPVPRPRPAGVPGPGERRGGPLGDVFGGGHLPLLGSRAGAVRAR